MGENATHETQSSVPPSVAVIKVLLYGWNLFWLRNVASDKLKDYKPKFNAAAPKEHCVCN